MKGLRGFPNVFKDTVPNWGNKLDSVPGQRGFKETKLRGHNYSSYQLVISTSQAQLTVSNHWARYNNIRSKHQAGRYHPVRAVPFFCGTNPKSNLRNCHENRVITTLNCIVNELGRLGASQ